MKIRFISDLHYTDPRLFTKAKAKAHDSYIKSILDQLFSKSADLYLSLGDLTHTGADSEIKITYAWIAEHPEAATKFHHIFGNHDLLVYDRSEWPDTYYKGNYFQSFAGFHIIYLETARVKNAANYGGYISSEIISWLAEKIEQTGEEPLLVFAHHPVKNTSRLSWSTMMHVDEDCNLQMVLAKKKGPAFYISAHNHCDSILHSGQWTYLQSACELEYPAIKNIEIDAEHLSYYFEDLETSDLVAARAEFLYDMPDFPLYGSPAKGSILERQLFMNFSAD
ncbi:MAG: metallophosphoesterase [Clostridiaceae bacterium]|mgnify:CR=1 FL=1|nr:metallophosphoesterase [Clostridiaceae bacterium]